MQSQAKHNGSIERYGYFDTGDNSFVLHSEPPKKWVNLHCNRIGDDEIYAELTNIGDGPVWVRDKDGCRCDLVGYDSKYLYIRDDSSGEVFCPWGAPAPREVSGRECRYYASKTEISSECLGLKVKQRVFVPRDMAAEVWTLTINNTTNAPRELSAFAYAMFQLTGCDSEGRGVWKENIAEVMPEIGGVFIRNRQPNLPHDRFKGYLVTPGDGFYNGNGYRDHFTRSEFALGTPRILWGWDCDGRPGYGPDCAGIVQVKLRVEANSSARVDFILGQAASPNQVMEIRGKMSPENIDVMCKEQEEIAAQQQRMFNIETGYHNIDALMNIFVKKQIYCYTINKSGFRDNLQNDCAMAMFDYPSARGNLLRAMSSQYPDGSVPHGFRPLNRLQYSDKPAWIFLTVPELVKESGDFSILDETVPFLESGESDSVIGHMTRAMRFLANDVGKNGLCNQHHADWNDGLEATPESGERESVMVSMQFCYGMLEFAELSRRYGNTELAAEAMGYYQSFKKLLNELAWDGEWYVRTICGDGYRIGSKENFEGKIFLNTQSWAVISKVAEGERANTCMASVDKFLESEIGFRICYPGFSKFDPRVGRMSAAIPDHIENGGCYNHAAGFKAVADCMMGRAEEAWRTFIKVAPDSPWNPVSQSETEPFSFTNAYSMSNLIYGKSCYPWRTGTAAWFAMVLLEWILGARRHYDGLQITPCLAKKLANPRLSRVFRGTRYEIDIDNTTGTNQAPDKILVNGKPVPGNIIPPGQPGETVKVKVLS